MSFIVHQRIGGRVYAYEVETYWDKEKKSPRQRRRYLGRVDERGNIIPKRVPRPRAALDHGDVTFALQVLREHGILELLRKSFPGLEDALMVLAVNRATRPVPFSRVRSWAMGTTLASRAADLSSQRISRILAMVGEDEASQRRFFAGWIRKQGSRLTLYYDITSMRSLARLNRLLEYGYDRSGGGAQRQLNFGVILDRGSGMPLCYRVMPGSLPDVSTLINTHQELRSMGVEDSFLVLDRGFYSLGNMEAMLQEGAGFLVKVPFSSGMALRLLVKNQRRLLSPGSVQSYGDRVVHVLQGTTMVKDEEVGFLLTYEASKEAEQRERFLRALMEHERKLRGLDLGRWVSRLGREAVLREVAGKYWRFFRITENHRVERRGKAISRVLNRLGRGVFFYKGDMDWREVLDLYASRDDVEKVFRAVKTDLEGLPMRVHSEAAAKGHLFVVFLSSLILAGMRRRMRRSGLAGEMSLPMALQELGKIRRVVLHDGREMLTELTRRQRMIIEKLDIKLET
jgi:transposase